MSGPNILDPSFPQYFQDGIIPPAEQPKFVTALKEMMDAARTATVEKLAELQLPAAMEEPVDEARVEVERAQVLDTCAWQMANLLRVRLRSPSFSFQEIAVLIQDVVLAAFAHHRSRTLPPRRDRRAQRSYTRRYARDATRRCAAQDSGSRG